MSAPRNEVLENAFYEITNRHVKDMSPGEAAELLAAIPNLEQKLEDKKINRQELENYLNSFQKSLFRKLLGMGGAAVNVATWPVRKILWPPIKWYCKNPVRNTLLIVLAVILLLYMTPAPPGPGGFRDDLIKQGEEILKKTGVPTPQVSTEAISKVGVTGGAVTQEVIKKGGEIAESPAKVLEHIQKSKVLEERLKKLPQFPD